MKLHFEPNLDYQLEAIESVCELFRGQETCRTEFTVTRDPTDHQARMGFHENDLGVGNRLTLLDDEIHENLKAIQRKNGLAPSGSLTSGDFTVEMETGTGKTYVYLRTIFELNKRYGFTKFVIVVPSVAIKEGVYKSLQMTEEHMRSLYANTPYEYFLYDSTKLGQVRNFATSPHIQIMVVTVGAINKKDVNNLYKDSEKTGGEKPIDLVKATHPIVIVDEPQSVDGGLKGRGKEALEAMNPLCKLRYSATHVDKYHMVYRLDAIDAYERKLVKQIEVASATVEHAHNKPYIRIVSVSNRRGTINAKVEIDVNTLTGVMRREVTVQDGDDLEQTTGRAIYANCRIGEIRVEKDNEFVELRAPDGEHFLRIGEIYGDVDTLAVQRQMIRRTIKEHLDKEKRLRLQGIKILSLFFVDAVNNYRQYDDDGNPVKGPYAEIFEEEYGRFRNHPDYRTLFKEVDLSKPPEEVHNGYFSIDRKKVAGKTVEVFKDTRGDTQADDQTYNLIMKDKEKLLSFETPLKFIFSHSALREGWDNPNVFQICALRPMGTERERRQTIGRGLRLCVNQDGERVRGFDVNTLTVIATEDYEQYAQNLQKEIEEDTGIRFGVVEPGAFVYVEIKAADGSATTLGVDRSKELWAFLKSEGYIDAKGRVQDSLRAEIKSGEFKVPQEFKEQEGEITQILRKLAGRLEIKNADERRQVRPRQAILQSEEFKALWDRIKHKTTYRVAFDNERLIEECTAAVRDAPPISRARLEWRLAGLSIGKSGVEATEIESSMPVPLEEADIELPDLLTDLQNRTHLTRRTVQRILSASQRLDDFKRNPQDFIEMAANAINRCKKYALVDGIKYHKLGDEYYYAQELFEQKELTGYLRNMLMDTQKSVYEHVVYDFGIESSFANQMEKNDWVKVYAKLPGWFQVPTPLGSYNPDWAVLVEIDEGERVYFVAETKSSLYKDDLRMREGGKIDCGEAHFRALATGDTPAQYTTATDLNDLFAKAQR